MLILQKQIMLVRILYTQELYTTQLNAKNYQCPVITHIFNNYNILSIFGNTDAQKKKKFIYIHTSSFLFFMGIAAWHLSLEHTIELTKFCSSLLIQRLH